MYSNPHNTVNINYIFGKNIERESYLVYESMDWVILLEWSFEIYNFKLSIDFFESGCIHLRCQE